MATEPGAGRPLGGVRHSATHSTETKSAFKTTEFVAYVLVFALILISAAVVSGGDDNQDDFIARQAWLYITILTSAYFIGRGLAKAGSRERYGDDDHGNELRR